MRCAVVNTPALKAVESHDVPDYPHLGLGYVAAFARARGFECDVIDAKLERLSSADVLGRVRKGKYDIVGLSAMTHDIAEAGKLANLIFDTRSAGHRALAAILGVILRLPPLKQSLAGEQIASRYLERLLARRARPVSAAPQ